MFRIEAYTSESQIEDIDLITPMIKNHMESIGCSGSLEQVKHALLQAMGPSSKAVLFVGYNESAAPISFAFGNIGVGLETGRYFWLNEIHVDASYRRMGYASAILAGIKKWLKEKNIYYIATMTGEKNVASQGLFRNNGFSLENIIWIDQELREK